MRKGQSILIALTSFLSFITTPTPLAADEPEQGVARISVVRGDVSTLRGDSDDWVATSVNAPLVAGDTLSTGPDSRAEVQLDSANVLRLDQETQVKIADLEASLLQVQVLQGQIDFAILRHSKAEAEIDTPNVAVRPYADGVYRIEVNSDSETDLIVRRGEAEVSTAEGSTTIGADQLISIEGTDDPEYQVVAAPERDNWDYWNQDRDREILDAESWQYVNNYYVGACDLDRYGRWVSVPGYGWAWSPSVDDPLWAPYRAGRWVWEPYWGWTWVSYEPWGWAPYHYGRWFVYGDSWVWWPGPVERAYYPVWAPAYVSFFGFGFGGRNWSFGFGFGYQSVGWLPVGPSDYYYPWSGSRYTYNTVNVTNIANVTDITNSRNSAAVPPLATARQPVMSNIQVVSGNVRVRQAVTTISTVDFVAGQVPRRLETVEVSTLQQAHLIQGTVPAVPTRESLRPANQRVNAAWLPKQSVNTRHIFTKAQPPAGPQRFSENAAEIRRMVQQRNPVGGGGATAGPTVAIDEHRSTTRQESVIQPGHAPTPAVPSIRAGAEPSPEAAGERLGWQRFSSSDESGTSGTNAAGRFHRAGPLTRAEAGENAEPSRSEPAPREEPQTPSVREEELRVTSREDSHRSAAKPEPASHPSEQAASPGWRHFGGEGSSKEKNSSGEKEREKKSEPEKPKPQEQKPAPKSK